MMTNQNTNKPSANPGKSQPNKKQAPAEKTNRNK